MADRERATRTHVWLVVGAAVVLMSIVVAIGRRRDDWDKLDDALYGIARSSTVASYVRSHARAFEVTK